MPDSRAFRVLLYASVGVILVSAGINAGWQVFAGQAPEPGWMARTWAACWFVAIGLTGAAACVLMAGRRHRG